MFKKYMLKLSNTVGTVNYLHKITKENDKNNNQQTRKHKKHLYPRNSMTAEMLLDIGAVPVVPEVTEEEALMDIDCSRLAGSDEEEDQQQQQLLKTTPSILSAAILNLRNTLMFYPLVFGWQLPVVPDNLIFFFFFNVLTHLF